MEEFAEYLQRIFGVRNGTANSYKKAIEILDDIFMQRDVLQLSGKSIATITDVGVINNIYEFVKAEEKKMRAGQDSIFKYGKTSQPKTTLNDMKASASHCPTNSAQAKNFSADTEKK